MAKEIERKFLVVGDSYADMAESAVELMQGYLSRRREATVRVRIAGDKAFLTVKGENRGVVRDEWEYPVPVADARCMMQCCEGTIISKTRYLVPYSGLLWEVDRFHGVLEGLVVAEVELESEDAPLGILPPFIGREVTGDARYYNSSLSAASAPPQES